VEVDGEWIRIIGRTIDVINIGGVKVLPSDIEATVLSNPNILHATVSAGSNPITGEHIELTCQLKEGASLKRAELKKFLKQKLPDSHVPHRIKFAEVKINHRFKRQ
jgi:acyl-coenzyme A synthetase/AMP-(fatty) acid ligase